MTLRNHLVLFVRAPRLGTVKSRLAKHIGPVAAWAFYHRALAGVVRRLSTSPHWQCRLAVTPDRAARAAPYWPRGCPLLPQGAGGLGERMDRVMTALPPGPVVIVGADIPDVRPHHITAAFRALGSHDAVFGPASDGGYWLVGLKRRPVVPRIFEHVRWSTPHALADTRRNLPPGLTSVLVETLDDIDTGADLERWRRAHST